METRQAFWSDRIDAELNLKTGGKPLRLSPRKDEANANIFHLVVGLGGSGVQAMLEAKGRIEQCVYDAGYSVAYLAIDTDEKDLRERRSSPETGAVGVDWSTEAVLLSDAGAGGLFSPDRIEGTRREYPELFDWVDERIQPTGMQNGAGGTRQLARLALFRNYEGAYRRICDAIYHLVTRKAMCGRMELIIHVIAGIAGGTGGALLIDLPYLLRRAVAELNDADRTQIFGYAFMPDVYFGSGADEDMLKRNGYAALQELDYNLSRYDLDETCNILYPGETHAVGSDGYRYLDGLHTIFRRNEWGISAKKPLEHSVRVVADHILSFVVKEWDGSVFSFVASYRHLGLTATFAIDKIVGPHRFHNYVAIGAAEYGLPVDDIMMYVASLMFDRLDGALERQPGRDDGKEAIRALGLGREDLFGALKRRMEAGMQMPRDRSFAELSANGNFWQGEGINRYIHISSLLRGAAGDALASEIAAELQERFDAYLEEVFEDPDRGPVFAQRLIAEDILEHIGVTRTELRRNWIGCLPDTAPELAKDIESYQKLVADMNVNLPILGRGDEKFRREEQINGAGRAIYEKCVELALAETLDKILKQLYNFVSARESEFFAVTSHILRRMRDVVRENRDILIDPDKAVAQGGKTFAGEPLSASTVSHVVKELFDALYGKRSPEQNREFFCGLYRKAKEWVVNPQSFDPNAFLSDFLHEHFEAIEQLSLENALDELLGVPEAQEALESVLRKTILPRLEAQARPLYFPAEERYRSDIYREWRLIYVPKFCRKVHETVCSYFGEKYPGGNFVQLCDSCKNIRIQTVRIALPLAAFDGIRECEEAYARGRDDAKDGVGLHLVHTLNSPHRRDNKSWNELYTLIPRCDRPDEEFPPAVRKLLNEEDERKALFRKLIEGNSPIAKLERGESKWTLELRLTLPDFRAEGDSLEWVFVGPALKRWMRGAAEDEAELRALLVNGLAELPKSFAKTRCVEVEPIMDLSELNEIRTMDALLEKCQCSLELVRAVREEKAKYEAIEAFLAQN